MPLPTFSMEINKNYIKIYFYLFFFLHLSKAQSWAPNPSCLSQYQTEFRIFSLSFQKSKISRKKSVIHSLSQSLWGKPVLSILSTAFLLGFWLYSILVLCVQDFHSVDNKIKLVYLPSSRIQCYCSWFIKIFINKNSSSRAV